MLSLQHYEPGSKDFILAKIKLQIGHAFAFVYTNTYIYDISIIDISMNSKSGHEHAKVGRKPAVNLPTQDQQVEITVLKSGHQPVKVNRMSNGQIAEKWP